MFTAGTNPAQPPAGQALALVANASAADLIDELARHGYRASSVDDPYAAIVELLDRPMVYRALVVSLPALYREELAIIRTVRARLPHIDVLLAHTDGRHAALAEAMRLGATGLLSEDDIHRLAEVEPSTPDELDPPAASAETAPVRESASAAAPPRSRHQSMPIDADDEALEPILTADELRALLHEQPTAPPQLG